MDPKKIIAKNLEGNAREIYRHQGGAGNKWDRWEEILPALELAWAAYEQLHGIPASVWMEQERSLFNLAPRLYRDYRNGITPAQEHGAARTALVDHLGNHFKNWGKAITLRDIEGYFGSKA